MANYLLKIDKLITHPGLVATQTRFCAQLCLYMQISVLITTQTWSFINILQPSNGQIIKYMCNSTQNI